MQYYTVTLIHNATRREIEFTCLADSARECLHAAYEEYPKAEYTYKSFERGDSFI